MLALPEKNSGLDQEELSKKIYVQRQFARFALELAVSGVFPDMHLALSFFKSIASYFSNL